MLNLRASWKPQGFKGLELGLKVNNVLDRRTSSFGALAETLFTSSGRYSGDERAALFAAPGAPRAVFVTARWVF